MIGDEEIAAAEEIVIGEVLEYSSSVTNRDGRSENTTVGEATKIPEFVSDSPSSLVIVIDITGVNCSVEIGRSVSVGIGSIVISRDLLIIKTDSVVDCFIVKLSMDKSTVVDRIAGGLMITGEVPMSSPVPLKVSVIVAEGTITGAETEEVTDINCSMVDGDKEIVAAVVISVLGKELEYSELAAKISIEFSDFVIAARFSLNETLAEGLVAILLGVGDIATAKAGGGETVNVLTED